MITIESWKEIMANQKKQQKEISKTKRVMYGLAAVLVLAVMGVAVGGFFFMLRHSQPAGDANVVKTEVVANGENRFIVHTDKKWMTMQNDGGTHYDEKFLMDFETKELWQLEDYYKGFSGWGYQNYQVEYRALTDDEIAELKDIIADIRENKEELSKYDGEVMPYALDDGSEKIDIYDKSTINRLSKVLRYRVRYDDVDETSPYVEPGTDL